MMPCFDSELSETSKIYVFFPIGVMFQTKPEEEVTEEKPPTESGEAEVTPAPDVPTSPVPPIGVEAVESDTTIEAPASPVPKEVLPLIDLTPFLRFVI